MGPLAWRERRLATMPEGRRIARVVTEGRSELGTGRHHRASRRQGRVPAGAMVPGRGIANAGSLGGARGAQPAGPEDLGPNEASAETIQVSSVVGVLVPDEEGLRRGDLGDVEGALADLGLDARDEQGHGGGLLVRHARLVNLLNVVVEEARRGR